MPLGDYLVGLAFFLVTWGAVGAATALVLRRRLGAVLGAPRAVAAGVVATAGLLAVHLVPLALGVLSRGTAALAALVVLVVVLWLPHSPDAASHAVDLPATPSGRLSWLLAAAGLAAYLGCALVWLRHTAAYPIAFGDAVNFHLPGLARWIQSGSLWQNDEFVPGFPTGAYPSNGNVVQLAAVLPWRNDSFVRFASFPYLALLGAGTYAAARELRASRAPAVLLATLLVALPIVTSPGLLRVVPDPIMLATFAAGVAFLVRHARTGERADLVLAGVALGIAFGTKWYGISAVVVVLGVWAAARLVARRPLGGVVRQGAALTGLVLGGGGIWLVRNLVETGSPLYPVRVAAFGVTLFDAPPDRLGERYSFTLAHYLGRGDIWREHILPDYTRVFGLGGVALLAGLLIAAGLALGRRAEGQRAVVLALVVSVAGLAAAYVITPGTAQGPRDHPSPGLIGGNARSLAPALVIAAALGAWALRRLRRAGILLEILAFAGIVDAVARDFDLPRWRTALFGAGGAALLLAARTVRNRWRAPAGPALAAVATALLLLAILTGQVLQARFNAHRYHGLDAAVDRVLEQPAHRRIGLVGASSTALLPPTYALFGPRLENEVTYVGPMNAGTLLDYTQESGFRDALRRGRYDLLVVSHGGVLRPDGSFSGGQVTSRLLAWARASGYRPIAHSDFLTLLRAPARRAGA